jgi:hypothetical protein
MTKVNHISNPKKHSINGNHAISKKHQIRTGKKPDSATRRDYKKSISASLVYRSLKVDNDEYVGFKVTYSGKGGRGNYDRSRLSIILIPDISVVRGYRPIAGAVARATRGEVITCSYSAHGGHNDRLIDLIINRSKYVKSKLRWVDIISQNDEILEEFRRRLLAVDKLSDALDAVQIETPEGDHHEESLQDAPASPVNVPMKVNVKHHSKKTRRVQLIKISTRKDAQKGETKGLVSRMVSSVMSKLEKIFASPPEPREKNQFSVSGVFSISEKAYRVDDKLNFANPHHCDLMARDMLKQ